jgi:hypothetical protein
MIGSNGNAVVKTVIDLRVQLKKLGISLPSRRGLASEE